MSIDSHFSNWKSHNKKQKQKNVQKLSFISSENPAKERRIYSCFYSLWNSYCDWPKTESKVLGFLYLWMSPPDSEDNTWERRARGTDQAHHCCPPARAMARILIRLSNPHGTWWITDINLSGHNSLRAHQSYVHATAFCKHIFYVCIDWVRAVIIHQNVLVP